MLLRALAHACRQSREGRPCWTLEGNRSASSMWQKGEIKASPYCLLEDLAALWSCFTRVSDAMCGCKRFPCLIGGGCILSPAFRTKLQYLQDNREHRKSRTGSLFGHPASMDSGLDSQKRGVRKKGGETSPSLRKAPGASSGGAAGAAVPIRGLIGTNEGKATDFYPRSTRAFWQLCRS